MSDRPTASLFLLAAIFCFAGVMHVIKPGPFIGIVPRWLPAPAALVLVSGVCEVLGGVGILWPVTRTAAGWGLIALLVAVFPANVQMLLDAYARHTSTAWRLGLWARLPLQPLLVWWVWRAAIRR